MTKRNSDPISLSEALGEFVDHNNLQTGINKVEVFNAWYKLNPAFKSYTTSLKFEKTTLFVQLNSSVFREELSYGKEKMIKILNEALGKEIIKKIVLR